MATETTYLTLTLDCPKFKPLEIVCDYDFFTTDVRPWLNSSDRAGRYAYEIIYRQSGHTTWKFMFSDPNVELEFKMRWL